MVVLLPEVPPLRRAENLGLTLAQAAEAVANPGCWRNVRSPPNPLPPCVGDPAPVVVVGSVTPWEVRQAVYA